MERRDFELQTIQQINLMFTTGDVVELRALRPGGGLLDSGFFTDPEKLATAAQELSGEAKGVYITLNPVVSNFVPKGYENELANGTVDAAKDGNIVCRRNLLIDIDPKRPSNVSATDAEHDLALAKAQAIRAELSAEGWPLPIVGDSGNGAHLIYKLPNLPNSPGSTARIKAILQEMATRWSGDGIDIDVSVFNPARITKLYGTAVCKGENTEERPWRYALILEAPHALEPVGVNVLEAFAEVETPTPADTTKQRTEWSESGRMERFIAKHGIHTRPKKPYGDDGGNMWPLDACAFNPSHTGTDAYLFEMASGALGYKCSHNSCIDNRWREFRALYEPSKDDRQGQCAHVDLTTPVFDLSTLPSISAANIPPVEYLVSGLIVKSAVGMISGKFASGKSTIILSMADAIARGAEWCGFQTKRASVLYLDRENPVSIVQERLKRMGIVDGPNFKIWSTHAFDGVPSIFDHNLDSHLITRYVENNPNSLIIVDSLVGFLPQGASENDATHIRPFMNRARQWAGMGATVVLLHHTGKGEASKQYRGSSDIPGSIDFGFVANPEYGDQNKLAAITLDLVKQRTLLEGGLTFDYDGCSFSKAVRRVKPAPKSDRDIMVEILSGSSDGMAKTTFEAMATAAGIKQKQARSFVTTGVTLGHIKVTVGSKNANLLRWLGASATQNPLMEATVN